MLLLFFFLEETRFIQENQIILSLLLSVCPIPHSTEKQEVKQSRCFFETMRGTYE